MLNFKLIKPDPFNLRAIMDALKAEGDAIADDIVKDFELTVSTFEEKPKFKKVTSISIKSLSLNAYTTNERYLALSEGVPSRVVTLSEGKRAFKIPLTYTSKTIPGVLQARPGGRSAESRYISTSDRSLTVGPIQARHFERLVFLRRGKEIPKRLQEAVYRGAKGSGHSM
jgi:hypothetical protein